MAKNIQRPSIERLRELFHADFERGILIRKISNNQYPVGEFSGCYDPSCGYYRVAIDQKRYLVHQVIWAMKTGEWSKKHINHISGSLTDNRFDNLRESTRRQSKQSSKLYRNNKFGLKGVSKFKSCFRSDIRVNGKTLYLGLHDTPEQGHQAYIRAAKKYFQEFARAS